MSATRSARTLPIPPTQWHAVITTFLKQLGTPTQVVPPGADPAGEVAEQVAWGRGAAELRCIKEQGDTDDGFVPSGVEVFAGFQTPADTTLAFNLLKTRLKVKDDLHTIYEYALVGGKVQSRAILLGSFYLDQNGSARAVSADARADSSARADSDALGVIHNPDYPGKTALAVAPYGGAGQPLGQALAYCLAGAISAVATAWLLRRRR